MTCRAYDGTVIPHQRHVRIQFPKTVYDKHQDNAGAHQNGRENGNRTETQRWLVGGSFKDALRAIVLYICQEYTLGYEIMEQSQSSGEREAIPVRKL